MEHQQDKNRKENKEAATATDEKRSPNAEPCQTVETIILTEPSGGRGEAGNKTWQTVKGNSSTVERTKGTDPTPLSNSFLVLEERLAKEGPTDDTQMLVAEPRSTREFVIVQVPGIGTLNPISETRLEGKKNPKDSWEGGT